VRRFVSAVKYAVLSLYGIISLFPFVLVILTSLKHKKDALSNPLSMKFVPTLDNFLYQLENGDVYKAIGHSLIIALCATLAAILLGIFSSYAMSRLRFRGKTMSQGAILSLRLIPPISLVIPYFIIFSKLGLLDSYFSIIVMYLTICLPLIVWMMKSFYDELPIELDEAACVDGCTRLQTLWYVLLPPIAPGIFASAALTFIVMWNEFMYALYITGSNTRTLPVEIYNSIGYYSLDWGKMAATAVIAIIPAILFIALAQKYIVKGLTMGAVKG
jgi:multiple sugar transport system permease protein